MKSLSLIKIFAVCFLSLILKSVNNFIKIFKNFKNLAGPTRKDPGIFFRRHPLHEISSSFLYVQESFPVRMSCILRAAWSVSGHAGIWAVRKSEYVFSSNHDNGLGRFGFRTGVISASRGWTRCRLSYRRARMQVKNAPFYYNFW